LLVTFGIGGEELRASRILYVENDPVLRGVITQILAAREEMEISHSLENSDQVLALADFSGIDAALIDLDLGAHSLSGIEIGLVLKEKNPNIGIVIFTQHVVPDFMEKLPDQYSMGWSFIEKRGDISMDYLVDVLKATARGLNVVDPSVQRARTQTGANPLEQLTGRQREILALAATGLDAPSIAAELNLAAVTVRQDLSMAYKVLIPDPKPGTDLRMSAVLAYLRLSRTYSDQE
jgi:DNA-binding NarL/FixJ family response regulator